VLFFLILLYRKHPSGAFLFVFDFTLPKMGQRKIFAFCVGLCYNGLMAQFLSLNIENGELSNKNG
jgi:hypothetical protein